MDLNPSVADLSLRPRDMVVMSSLEQSFVSQGGAPGIQKMKPSPIAWMDSQGRLRNSVVEFGFNVLRMSGSDPRNVYTTQGEMWAYDPVSGFEDVLEGQQYGVLFDYIGISWDGGATFAPQTVGSSQVRNNIYSGSVNEAEVVVKVVLVPRPNVIVGPLIARKVLSF